MGGLEIGISCITVYPIRNRRPAHTHTRVPPDYTFPLPPGVHLDDVGSLMHLVDAWELRKADLAVGFWIYLFINWAIIDNNIGFIGVPLVGG
jgi:hypothetical protein